jgi:cytochrome b561
MTPNRYHPLLVTLHWLLALLVIAHLLLGGLVLDAMPNNVEKHLPLAIHMGVGIAIGVLLLLRLGTRFVTAKPPPARTGRPWLDRLGRINHFLLYALVLFMVSTGIGTAILSGALEVVFAGRGELPESFAAFPPMDGHALFSKLLAALILLHVAAALYHRLALRDGVLGRMGFRGPRFSAGDEGAGE